VLDAIRLAADTMRGAQFKNRALVVISDCGDNESRTSATTLEQDLRAALISLYVLAPRDPTPLGIHFSEEVEARASVWRIAPRTGGYAAGVITRSELLGIVKQLAAGIRSPYVLYFEQPASSPAPSRLLVEIPKLKRKALVQSSGAYRRE
jgi:Ca-activated chloride channel family protein